MIVVDAPCVIVWKGAVRVNVVTSFASEYSRRLLVLVLVLVLVGARMSFALDLAEPSDPLEFFEKQVRPILVERCQECHSASSKRVRGELRLDSREALRRGGVSGPAIVPGDPEASFLIERIRDDDDSSRMPPPPKEPLTQAERSILETWIKLGAPDPRTEPTPAPAPNQDPRGWWAFQALANPPIPIVQDAGWARNELDRFIQSRLEREGLRPAPEADRSTWIRRLTFDLTGLPPAPEEVEAFVSDPRPDAHERLVDRLLASPHHGERWGRHWLDLVRYADTSGCNGDFPIPEAYRYRNYVITRFNQDAAYDQFIREQLAGDLLPAASEDQRREQLVATGYLAISRRFSSVAEEFHLTLDDAIDNLGKTFLALSVSCARCHDHKFDPIPQRDYYALHGILESTRFSFPGTEIYRHQQDMIPLVTQRIMDSELRSILDAMEKIDAEIHQVYTTIELSDTGKEKDALKARWESLKKRRDDLLKSRPDYDEAYGAMEGKPVDSHIQLKGDPKKLGDRVPRGFLQVLGGQRVPADERGSGRKHLADWVADPKNPLTARVIVNRVWQHHFGQGLVRSHNDFGTRGQPPSHPELLDHLTRRFIDAGWSIKRLHRWIVLSSTYRTASAENPAAALKDPDNRWLWSFPRRRLDAEEIRDAMLFASGGLERRMGGPHPFPPEVTWRYSQHKPFVEDYPSDLRSVYLMQQRFRLQPYLATFDGADTNASTGERRTSTTPQQALFALNSAFVQREAERLVDRLDAERPTIEQRIQRAYWLLLSRKPSADEFQEATAYLKGVRKPLAQVVKLPSELERAAWVSLIRVLLSTNEFVFVD